MISEGSSVSISVIFSYGALVSSPDSRATRLAIYTGIETVFIVIGSLLSPFMKNYFGLYFNYGLKCGCTLIALLYAIFLVKEAPKNVEETKGIHNRLPLIKCIILLIDISLSYTLWDF